MSIYGTIRTVYSDLETTLFSSRISANEINKEYIISSIRNTWNNIEKYSKNIYPEYTDSIYNRIRSFNIEEMIITKEMYNKALGDFIKLKNHLNDVKSFYLHYFLLLDSLLIFNMDFKESCNICQGKLFYYYEKNSKLLVKACSTCGVIFNAKNDKIFPSDKELDLIPANKKEIETVINLNEVESIK